MKVSLYGELAGTGKPEPTVIYHGMTEPGFGLVTVVVSEPEFPQDPPRYGRSMAVQVFRTVAVPGPGLLVVPEGSYGGKYMPNLDPIHNDIEVRGQT